MLFTVNVSYLIFSTSSANSCILILPSNRVQEATKDDDFAFMNCQEIVQCEPLSRSLILEVLQVDDPVIALRDLDGAIVVVADAAVIV